MCDTEEKTLAEQLLETAQRVHETGRRYGLLDAKAGRLEPAMDAQAVAGPDWQAYVQGWETGYSLYLLRLRTPGTHVSIPSLVPGERIAAVTTGRLIEAGELYAEVLPGGSDSTAPPIRIPVRNIQVK